MERTHYLNNPFWARFVRFYPLQWNEQIGFRVGVYGCPFTSQCLPGYFRVNENSNCVENLAFRKEIWTNEKKKSKEIGWFNKNSLKARSFISLIQEGHPSLAVDGDEDNSLHKCAIIDNYYTERPTLVINLGRLTTIGGVVIKTWQGKGQDSNFPYRDYMYGLDRFSVFVDKRPLNSQFSAGGVVADTALNLKNQTVMNAILSTNQTSANSNGIVNTISIQHFTNYKLKLNENNLCNFVTRNNYAIFTPSIHLQCIKPLTGRYIYIQADGRSNRWSRLFNAVFCEIQAYEV